MIWCDMVSFPLGIVVAKTNSVEIETNMNIQFLQATVGTQDIGGLITPGQLLDIEFEFTLFIRANYMLCLA